MEFARPGDPLVTKDGELIPSKARPEPKYSLQVPIAKTLLPKTPRSVRDLGTEAQTQTVLNAILLYHLLGVSVNEIAHVLGIKISQVQHIMDMSAYQETFEMLFKEIISTNSDSMQARIASYAGKALDNLMDLADAKPVKIKKADDDGEMHEVDHYSVPPLVILKANESILDRSGLSSENLYGQADNGSAQQLEIVVRSDEDAKTDVRINVKGMK